MEVAKYHTQFSHESKVADDLKKKGVKLDVEKKIETFENNTPVELRDEDFRANRVRKKGTLSNIIIFRYIYKRIFSAN